MTGAFVLGEVAAYWSGNEVLFWSGLFLLFAGILVLSAGRSSGRKQLRTREMAGAGDGTEAVGIRCLSFYLLMLLCFCAGWGRMSLEERARPLEQYLITEAELSGHSVYQGREAVVWGILTGCSEREKDYRLELSDVRISLSGEKQALSFREPALLITAERETVARKNGNGLPSCGEELEVSGMLSLFSGARNPGQFDDRLYYRGKKIRCRLRAKEIKTSGKEGEAVIRQPARHLAGKFREWVREALRIVCCEEDRGIFQAVLLGDRTELSRETLELFQDNGIAHILAVSGLHVSLIGMGMYQGLRFLGLGYGAAGGVAGAVLLFYGSVTGFSSSVFRAIFMVLCAFLAAYLGRTYDLLSAMALSLFLLAADSPYLLCSGGLQLSYASVLAVGLTQELRQREKRREDPENPADENNLSDGRKLLRRWNQETLQMGVAIQQMTLPVLLYHFFKYPLWGIVLNLLVIPLLSFAAGSGMAAVGLYTVSRALQCFPGALSSVFGRLAVSSVGPGHYIFALYRRLCSVTGSLPFASITAGRPALWMMALYYGALFWWYVRRFHDKRPGLPDLGWFCLGILLLFPRPVQGLEIWFLDVGQGDGVVIQTGDGAVLSDCGSSQDSSVGKNRLVPFLESQGINHLDYVLVSHCDQDHMNGILWLLEEEPEISVETLVLPLAGCGQEEYQPMVDAAVRRGIRISYLASGDQLWIGGACFTCLHPEAGRKDADTSGKPDANSQSLVFEIRYRAFSMLLTGDIGSGEERLLTEELNAVYGAADKRLTVLKAAHHGSAGSSSEEFLEAVRPEITVLSYGERNRYGHPAPETVKRLNLVGTALKATAESGAIHLRTDGRKLWIRPFLIPQESFYFPVDKKEENGL